MENGNTRRGDIYEMRTNTITGHTQRGDTYGLKTHTEKKYRPYTKKRYIWSGDKYRDSIYTEKEHK